MPTNDIRLIAMDMDGTLLNNRCEISQGNRQALLDARKQGIQLAICSGRLSGDIAAFAVENGLEDCALLALNGAYCQRRPGAPAFTNHLLDAHILDQLAHVLADSGLTYTFFAHNAVAVFQNCRCMQESYWFSHREGPYASALFQGEEGYRRLKPIGVNKIVCLSDCEERLQALRAKLEPFSMMLDMFPSWPLNLEIMPRGCGKGGAVRELAQQLGLSAAQIMTLGDYDNDISMIAYAGLGVAMGNATEAVRRAAKQVTLTNDEDGVAWAIRRYALA